MYLGLTFISELCYPNGKCLHPSILSRIWDAGQYCTTLSRPNQPKPNTRSWVIWERVLSLITRSDKRTLRQPLGPWNDSHSMAGRWKSYQLHNTVHTLVQATDTWNQYTRRGNYLKLEATGVSFTPTSNHIPIYLQLRDSTPIQFLESLTRHDPPAEPPI